MIGIVVIGRNEGERLVRCLAALAGGAHPVVYVDSGSTDGSPARAASMGVEAAALDPATGFSAARARNLGFRRLMARPDGARPAFVQFVDGDCVLAPGWLAAARARLGAEPRLAAVAGRLREAAPEASIYNRLCDMEWDTPVGPASAVGGIAMYRADAFAAVGGFRDDLICGEEPELCLRLGRAGWRVERLPEPMACHDAAMTRASQWWQRARRSGWAWAEGAALHGAGPERYNRRRLASVRAWGGLVPMAILGLGLSALLAAMLGSPLWRPAAGLAGAGSLAYPLMALRIARARARTGTPWRHALLYGGFVMLGKIPEFLGTLAYARTRRQGARAEPIEYKGGAAPHSGPVGYLTGEYPKISHTFIQREIAALRARGIEIATFSIRKPSPGDLVGDEERKEFLTTFYVLNGARDPVALIGAHLWLLWEVPKRYFGALKLAISIGGPGARANLYQIFYFVEAGYLAHVLRRKGVRHLHNHFASSSCTVAMLASELSGIPFSFTAHGPSEFLQASRWALNEKVSRAAFAVCISNFCRSQLMFFSAFADWHKLHIVHCGIEPGRYRARNPADTGSRRAVENAVRLLFIGRLAAAKGCPVLIEALARALEAGAAVNLKIVGDGPDRRALESRVASLGLEHVVHFTGYQSQSAVAEHLAAADIFVLASFAEGVPVVLMEAMASSLPVIATQIAGIPELVEDGISGYLVPPGDPVALSERIAELAADPGLRLRMAEKGRKKVEKEFNCQRSAEQLAELFTLLHR